MNRLTFFSLLSFFTDKMITSNNLTNRTTLLPEGVMVPGWLQQAILLSPRLEGSPASSTSASTEASSEMKATEGDLNSLSVPTYQAEVKPVLYSSGGRVYEIGSLINKSLCGKVVKGCMLEPYDYDSCPSSSQQVPLPTRFTRTDVMVAIKFYSRKELARQQGKAQENPLLEISLLQMIHNYIRSQGDRWSQEMLPFVEPIECCYDEESIFFVMEYREGQQMFDYIDKNGPLTTQQAIGVFRDILIALDILEACGISHRDISLENILFDGQNATLIDFGMSIKMENGVRHIGNNQCGRVQYMPPEMIAGYHVVDGIYCDIWSTAVAFLAMLVGASPLDTASESDVRYLYLIEGKLDAMLDYWGVSLSPALIDLLNRMFKETPEDRPSAAMLLKHGLFAQQPALQKPASPCISNKILSIQCQYLSTYSPSAMATPFSPMTDSEEDDDDIMDCQSTDDECSVGSKRKFHDEEEKIEQEMVVTPQDEYDFYYVHEASNYDFTIPV